MTAPYCNYNGIKPPTQNSYTEATQENKRIYPLHVGKHFPVTNLSGPGFSLSTPSPPLQSVSSRLTSTNRMVTPSPLSLPSQSSTNQLFQQPAPLQSQYNHFIQPILPDQLAAQHQQQDQIPQNSNEVQPHFHLLPQLFHQSQSQRHHQVQYFQPSQYHQLPNQPQLSQQSLDHYQNTINYQQYQQQPQIHYQQSKYGDIFDSQLPSQGVASLPFPSGVNQSTLAEIGTKGAPMNLSRLNPPCLQTQRRASLLSFQAGSMDTCIRTNSNGLDQIGLQVDSQLNEMPSSQLVNVLQHRPQIEKHENGTPQPSDATQVEPTPQANVKHAEGAHEDGTKKKRGRPKKLILDPTTNNYIDSSHENFKRLNKLLKESEAKTKGKNGPKSNGMKFDLLNDQDLKQLLELKDRRGRPRKFPIELTGVTIKGVRVNGSKSRSKSVSSPDPGTTKVAKRGRPKKEKTSS